MFSYAKLLGRFRQWKGRLQMWFGSLLADGRLYHQGERACFWGKIEKHAGKSKNEIRKFFDENRYEPPDQKTLF